MEFVESTESVEKPICFIISHRYYRTYPSYIQYYVDNIQKYYENALTIIVDNNSSHLDDIREKLADYKNVIILVNDTECKFELGAYNEGIRYLINHNIYNDYSYVVFSQDTFVLKNKFDFREFTQKKTTAGVFIGSECGQDFEYGLNLHPTTQYFWNKLEMDKYYPFLNKGFCWCCSFFLHSSKIGEFLNLTQHIVIKVRNDSCALERYLWMIMYRLNNNKLENIDGLLEHIHLKYDCHRVNIINDSVSCYFVKHTQQKTETTPE